MGIFISLILATIRQAAPILITAIGGAFSEITGVVNIGLEGMMLMGAFSAAIGSYYTGNPYIGIISGMVAGGLMAAVHAVLSIKYKGNQTVSGVAINLFASGFTVFMLRVLFNQSGNTPSVPKTPQLFGMSIIVYIIYILAFVAIFVVYRTVIGLRMRAVGEHPLAADTVGINVDKIRYIGVILSGMFAGLGGAYLSIGALAQFTKNMSAGRGFIALAAVVFGKWNPKGILLASLLFGFADGLQTLAQQYVKAIPPQFIQMLPYVLTLLALAGVVGKAVAPSASGKPYDKNEA
ncbi:nucleoside ABC transporter membrane protein [Hypnocyclicus thermotrophus]|uniref:Nucleoside ABC transporter membrane protein n=1 Tax=Hypnocyclicus thermotrophus TaxID=1627895 RepID=A0AA46E169_9FUSO|nr:ABC transporter permease [Hypnocyclicus thermotrophus]TDT72463.1 nucleoside ABC transporter membrane protein [Hypnocyclicus thermotrophus]